MDVCLTVLKLIIVTALLNPNSVIPIQLTIDNVVQEDIPFKISIHFELVDSNNKVVLTQTYEKMITQYKEVYSGILNLYPKLPPGIYELRASVSINNQPYMRFKQKIRIIDGLDVQFKSYKPPDSKGLNVDFTIQNTAGVDLTLVLFVRVYDEKGSLIINQKEIVSITSGGSVKKTIKVPLTNLPSGKYKADIGYGIVGNSEYYRIVGKIEFNLKNNLKNGNYLTQYLNYTIIGLLFIITLLYAVKK